MTEHPGPGRQDGDEPSAVGPSRDGTGAPADDWDGDAEMAAFLADIEAGRARVPEPWEVEGPTATISLGDACDVDVSEIAALCGPDGLAGEPFTRDGRAGEMRPGPVLAALAEHAAENLEGLSDNQLLGLISAAQRLANRAGYLQLRGIAEFTRRRAAQLEASKARKDPRGCRDGEFAAEELAFELTTSANAASYRMELASALATRLPETFAALAAGAIDTGRANAVWYYTQFLSDEHAAQADEILAAAAPGLRHDQLARKAARLEMKLDPDGVRRRKEGARKEGQRVEARREGSGNMSFGGRELAVEDALGAKTRIDADAAALRNAGLEGSLRELRVLAYLDRINGRDPLERAVAARPAQEQTRCHDRPGSDEGGGLAPLPALINITVPAGTLLGSSSTPGEVGAWGLTDPGDTRRLVQAASAHPRSRWCVTVTGPDGTAAAHGCARGQHPWIPPPDDLAPHAPPHAGQLRELNVTHTPIDTGTCDHRNAENRYAPSRTLKHLVRARTATSPAPGCAAHACHCDQDHTIPYPHGPTDECNLAPRCKR